MKLLLPLISISIAVGICIGLAIGHRIMEERILGIQNFSVCTEVETVPDCCGFDRDTDIFKLPTVPKEKK